MLGVDVGGTFTDVVSVRDGRIEVTKVPSSATDPATTPSASRSRRLRANSTGNSGSTLDIFIRLTFFVTMPWIRLSTPPTKTLPAETWATTPSGWASRKPPKRWW